MMKWRPQNYLDLVLFSPSLISCRLTNVIKFGGCQENFKVTLQEGPPENSYSTSQFSREISFKIFSPTKFQNHYAQLQIYERNLCNSKI